jgi:eukaryotic-like serine/threonine-protein kinase
LSDTGSDVDTVGKLAEAFLTRYRRGERPALSEYTSQHPELAEQIHDLFPALVMMEELGSVGGPATGQLGEAVPGQHEPRQLGEYRILREVGRGGMGVVYEAVQESLGRHVALKVFPGHGLLSATHLERFRRESKAAARLHHTNIVPVFGVGDSGGVHFYAMQFIQGQGLDEVLKELKRLRSQKGTTPPEPSERDADRSIAQQLLEGRWTEASRAQGQAAGSRQAGGVAPAAGASDTASTAHRSGPELTVLSEFQYFRSVARMGIQVAEALTHAHQQGILHRDIKPSNLLLDARGTVWVTDFGLAKSEGAEDLTNTGDIVGTLRYMAPERFNGWSDPRSDVYGLGITLYELLTLRPAFEDSNRSRLVEQVLHEDPPRLRKRDPRIPRDLETIVLKAAAKEPGNRYPTAEALAEDLRRFLGDRSIQARPATSAERTWRWCRRNPLVATLGAALGLILVGSVVGLTGLYLQADTQRQRAEAQKSRGDENLARALKAVEDYCVSVAEDARLKRADFHDLRTKLLETAVPFYEDFLRQRPDDPALSADQARAHYRLARLRAETGHAEEALADYERAAVIFAELLHAHPDEPEYLHGLAASHNYRANELSRLAQRTDEAEDSYGQAIALQQRLVDTFPQQPEYRRELARDHNNLAILLHTHGQAVEAERQYRRGLALNTNLVAEFPRSAEYRQALAVSHHDLAWMLYIQRRHTESEAGFQQALALQETLAKEFPEVPAYRQDLAETHNDLSALLCDLDRGSEAERHCRGAIDVLGKLAREFARVPDYRKDLAKCHSSLGSALAKAGRWPEAEQAERQGVALLEKLVEDFPQLPHYWAELGVAQCRLGRALTGRNRPDAALSCLDKAISLLDKTIAQGWRAAIVRGSLRDTHSSRAEALTALGRHKEAIKDLDRAIELDDGGRRATLQLDRASSLARAGEHAQAVAQAESIAAGKDVSASTFYAAACVHAQAAAAAKSDQLLCERYSKRAVELLRHAAGAGYKDGTHMKKDLDLEPLRSREDFKKLLADLEANSARE